MTTQEIETRTDGEQTIRPAGLFRRTERKIDVGKAVGLRRGGVAATSIKVSREQVRLLGVPLAERRRVVASGPIEPPRIPNPERPEAPSLGLSSESINQNPYAKRLGTFEAERRDGKPIGKIWPWSRKVGFIVYRYESLRLQNTQDEVVKVPVAEDVLINRHFRKPKQAIDAAEMALGLKVAKR